MTQAERAYYEKRAPEYDDWYLGIGLYSHRERPGWEEELESVRSALRSLSFRTILDVACGTGFLTRHLAARIVALDQSRSMLQVAQQRLSRGAVVQGDGLSLPFQTGSFECVSAGHFYGHLRRPERERFLTEARRVAKHVLIIDAGLHGQFGTEEVQQRILKDGSQHTVYKRYFAADQLTGELGGGHVLHAGHWFVAVLA
jgi:ubiquinone/menaquinone biosynthesis C-methylase UbiE